MKKPRREPLCTLLPCILLLTVAAIATPMQGQEDDDAAAEQGRLDDQIVVTANREELPISQVGSSVTVMTSAEIDQRNQLFVADLLRTMPGIELIQSGGPGKATTFSTRGGAGSQTLILIDGIRVNSVANGDYDFSNLTADNIERIEVVRGPQATYGSEAMSGVLSLTTRRGAEGWTASGAAEAGTRDHQRFRLGLSGRRQLFDYSLSGSSLSTDAVSQRSPPVGGEESDPYDNTTYTGRLGLTFLGDGRVNLSARGYDGDTALDGFGGEDLNFTQKTEGRNLAVTVDKNLGSSWHQRLRIGRSDTDLLGEDPDSFFNNYDITSQNTMAEAQADLFLASSNTLNLGLATEERKAVNVGAFDEQARLSSAFAQDQWSVTENVHLTGAVRYDDHSVFGDQTTFRVTATSALGSGDRTRVRGSYGTGFRAPTFNELYFPFSGDPTLQPERSAGWDLGFSHRLGGTPLHFDVAYFDLSFDDLILFDLDSFQFANVAEASSRGIELQLRYAPGATFDLSFSHTYNETEDRASGAPLPRRPRNRTTVAARFAPTRRLDGALMAFAVNDRIDSTGAEMDDYARVDLSLGYGALPWLRPYLRVENLFDEDYEEVSTFTTPGATYMVGVIVQRP